MSTTQAPAPTIRNAGTKPLTSHKLFVNIPVNDVQRSIRFFEALGFTFNPQFTDATSTAMLVGEDAYFMLLTKEKFASFSKRPAGDPQKQTTAMYALGVDSRAAVDEMVKTAVASVNCALKVKPSASKKSIERWRSLTGMLTNSLRGVAGLVPTLVSFGEDA